MDDITVVGLKHGEEHEHEYVCTHIWQAGELVALAKDTDTTGVVLQYWNSSAYEPASVDVMMDGEFRSYDVHDLIRLTPTPAMPITYRT